MSMSSVGTEICQASSAAHSLEGSTCKSPIKDDLSNGTLILKLISIQTVLRNIGRKSAYLRILHEAPLYSWKMSIFGMM